MRIDYQHRFYAHCETGTVASLLQHHGADLDEAMIFGIGSGLFFGYFPFVKIGNFQLISYRNAPGTIFKHTVKRLHVDFHVQRFQDPKKAMDALDALLDRGVPVGLQVGVYWLPYMPPPQQIHWNAHNIIIIGREGDDYIVSDPTNLDLVHCSREALVRARFAKGVMAPHGLMYHLEPGSWKGQDINGSLPEAIRGVCQQMLSVPVPMIGVRGIRLLAKNLRRWPSKLDAQAVKLNVGNVVIMSELIGSGGGGFRYMYSSFLKQAGERLKSHQLINASEKLTESGDRWRYFSASAARWSRGRPDPGMTYERLGNLMDDIAAGEEQVFRQLRQAVA